MRPAVDVVPDDDEGLLSDTRFATYALEKLREYAARRTRFFLAVGFKKPHLPFEVPARYYERYAKGDLADSQLVADAPAPWAPWRMPQAAYSVNEISLYSDMPADFGHSPVCTDCKLEINRTLAPTDVTRLRRAATLRRSRSSTRRSAGCWAGCGRTGSGIRRWCACGLTTGTI